MTEAKGFAWSVRVLGPAVRLGIFAGWEKVVEPHGCKLADSPPVLFEELWRLGHFHEFEEDGGVDGPYLVGSRICLGKVRRR